MQMAQTPLSGNTPYLIATRVWLYKDKRPVLELLLDDDTIATQDDAEDDSTTAGSVLLAALQAASGEVEEHCLRGKRYTPSDLAALTGNSKNRLEELVADLAFWKLGKKRWAGRKREDVTGANEAVETLKALADGELVFGLLEAADAGNAGTADLQMPQTTVTEAARIFGPRNWRG